jgi:ParB/RepB/Spo0J family partition protein
MMGRRKDLRRLRKCASGPVEEEIANRRLAMASATYQSIPVDQIIPSRHQVRKDLTEESVRSLAESLKQEGQLMPIIVRRQGDTGTGGQGENAVSPSLPVSQSPRPIYELVVGERRWRAAKLLGWKEIDARIIGTVSEAEAAAKGMVENLQREDLDPIEEAQGLADLNRLDPGYWTQAKIAEITGKTQSHVSETLRLLDLSDKIKENIRRRIISPEHGAELLRLPSLKIQQKVADSIVKQDLTVKKTRDLVNRLIQQKPASAAKTGHPAKDPLASLWPQLLANQAIPGVGAWGVAFKKGKWNFSVDSSAVSSQEALASWFKQMGEAIATWTSPRQSVSRPSTDPVGRVAGSVETRGPETSTPINAGLQSAGITSANDEEEQRQAALQDAAKSPKLGRPL